MASQAHVSDTIESRKNMSFDPKKLINTVIIHWNKPVSGNYVSFKEIISYSIGGFGLQFVMLFVGTIGLSAGSFLVGSAIGIQPLHLQYMGIASSIIGFGLQMVRSYLIDSSHFKLGKFRSWLCFMAFPTLIFALIFVWLPYETMAYSQKIIAVFISYILIQCVSPFFNDSYSGIINVISPNSEERTNIISISSIIWSLAPTITNATIPMLSEHFTGGLANIQTYRIIYPAFAVFGVFLSFFAVFGTKERITEAKSHVSQYKFTDALRAVAKNKYFWITSLAGWIGFLEGSSGVLMGWNFVYGHPDRMGTYTIATAITGNAALFAMILAPFIIRRIGKRFLLIWCNVANIVFIGATYFCFNNLIPFVLFCYLNGFVNSFAIVYNPGINADIRDYQQYKTGERIDGMFGTVGLVGTFIGMFTGMVLPTIYESLGLKNNYNVLEVASFREDMFSVLILASVIGAALNVIPYIFYDFTEIKQKGIARVLKIRALFEDYGNGLIKERELVEAIDIIDQANEHYKNRSNIVTEEDIKKAKKLSHKDISEREFRSSEILRLKKAYNDNKNALKTEMKENLMAAKQTKNTQLIKEAKRSNLEKRNEQKEITVCDFVVNEVNKFSTLRGKVQLERAKTLLAAPIENLYHFDAADLARSRALPKDSFENREIRSDEIAFQKLRKSCCKNINKYYKNGLIVPDMQKLYDAESLSEQTLREKLAKRKTVKALVEEKSRYNKSAKIILDAERTVKEFENYQRLDEIRSIYENAKQKVLEEDELRAKEFEELARQRAEELENRKNKKVNQK